MGVTHISNLAAFRSAIDNAGKKLVLVDFTATWCGPCRMIAPVFEQLSREYSSTVNFLKVDVDSAADVAQSCGISSMPTFQGYLNRNKVFQFSGADPNALRQHIVQYAPKTAAFGGSGQRLGGSESGTEGRKIDWGDGNKKKDEAGSVASAAAVDSAAGAKVDEEKREASEADGEKANGAAPGNDSRLPVNEGMVKQLEDMGFPKVRCEKGLILTGNKSVEAAMEWIFAHSEDADIDEPLQVVTSDGEAKPQLSLEERKRVANELAAKARAKREAKEKELKREQEKNRIRSGKEATLAKAKLEEVERKRKVETRRKERAEARAERERVREQLKADKEARMAKFKYEGIAAPAPETKPSSPIRPKVKKPPTPITGGKIQLRLPDGNRLEKEFEPTDTVGDVATYIAQERPDINRRGFHLSTQYPKRQFTEQEYSITLEAAQLLPRGALIVSYL